MSGSAEARSTNGSILISDSGLTCRNSHQPGARGGTRFGIYFPGTTHIRTLFDSFTSST